MMTSRSIWRPSQLVARQILRQAKCRTITSSARSLQQAPDSQQNGRTTHFGFETVPEAEKEARGVKQLPV